jgi:hypothetical protein
VFLAANQDAVQAGRKIGIAAANSVNFDATGEGVLYSMHVMHDKVAYSRSIRN